jgi:ferredoxin
MTTSSNPTAGRDQALKIDWTACDGRGLCADLLPELIAADPWGFPQPQSDAAPRSEPGPGEAPWAAPRRPAPGTLALVPEHLQPHARRAVHICPRLALRLAEQ